MILLTDIRKLRSIASMIFMLLLSVPILADSVSRTDTEGWESVRDSIVINFRQSKINIDPTYMGNAGALREIKERIEVMTNPDSLYQLNRIEILGAASPEGSVKFNQWLSHKRAAAIKSKITELVQIPDSTIAYTYTGRDWNGLLNMASADPELPYSAETIEMLADIARSNHSNAETESAGYLNLVKRLKSGTPYRYMYRNMFPQLRRSHVVLDYSRPSVKREHSTDNYAEVARDTVYIVTRDTVYIEYCPPCKPFYMDIRTNLLYDAAAIPNIGVEFYVGKGWTIGGNWQYGWWSKDSRHRYWRFYGGELNVRKWFGSRAAQKPLTGHHLGLYGEVATFDFEFGGKGHMGGIPGGTLWERCNYGGGLEYGYSLPIADRLNIDFSVGLGAFGGKLYEYVPGDNNNYYWTKTKNYVWFGPTKAEISLVWLLGCNNKNVKGYTR